MTNMNRRKYKKLVCIDSGNESFEPSGLCDEKIEEFCESLKNEQKRLKSE